MEYMMTTVWVSKKIRDELNSRLENNETVDQLLKRILQIKTSVILKKTKELEFTEIKK